MVKAAIVDIDGTLVDTNYQHAIAWDRAFAEHDVHVPLWRIHRHIGMGGDQLIAELAGEEVEASKGDAIRDTESERYGDLIGEVRVLEGARELIAGLAERDVAVVLASSAKGHEVEHYLELLGAEAQVEWTTADDVENTKPEPDLVEAALEKANTRDAIMLGDSVWDLKAADRAGIAAIGVLSGGFSEAELNEAGAIEVYESVMAIASDIDRALSR